MYQMNEASTNQIDIHIEEILEKGIPSLAKHYSHYYMSIEDDFSFPSTNSTMNEPNSLQLFDQFLRLPQI